MWSNAKYLGIPMFLTKNKTHDFCYLLSEVQRHSQRWRHKTLSWGSKGTLINSVIQSTPIYTMSILRVPVVVYDGLNQLSRRFWWKVSPDKSIHFTPLS